MSLIAKIYLTIVNIEFLLSVIKTTDTDGKALSEMQAEKPVARLILKGEMAFQCFRLPIHR